MPIKPRANPKLNSQLPASKETAETNGVVQIANFGLITPGKGIEKALRALASLKATHSFHYTLVGEPNSFSTCGPWFASTTWKTGSRSLDTLSSGSLNSGLGRLTSLSTCASVRLAKPPQALCRIMAAGVPAIVFNVGAFQSYRVMRW